MSATLSLLFWSARGDCRPGCPGEQVAPALCHFACPGWLLLGFVPGLPRIMLDPELILVLFAAADLLLGLAHLLARIPREPASDLAAVSGPGAGDHHRHCRCRPCHHWPFVAGGLCPGSRGLAHRCRGGQRDRQTTWLASPHRDRDRGREYGQ